MVDECPCWKLVFCIVIFVEYWEVKKWPIYQDLKSWFPTTTLSITASTSNVTTIITIVVNGISILMIIIIGTTIIFVLIIAIFITFIIMIFLIIYKCRYWYCITAMPINTNVRWWFSFLPLTFFLLNIIFFL